MRYDLGLALLRSTLVSASVGIGLIALAPGAASGQDACSQVQSMFPASPALLKSEPASRTGPGGCIGYYWQRVPRATAIGGLYEFGAQVSIITMASPAAAKALVRTGGTPVGYGDGGWERIELPGANDLRMPTKEEADSGKILEFSTFANLFEDDGNYHGRFTCGAYAVFVFANPTKGVAARRLIPELAANLGCRSGAVAAAAPAAPTAPVAAPVAPPTDPETEGGTRVFEGRTAGEILFANNSGSRYMAVLRRVWDPTRSCYVEDRAWVSSIKASGGGKVAVEVGPVLKVCVRGNVLSSADVNEAESRLRYTRDLLVTALKAKERHETYLSDPARRAWATGEIQKIDVFIRKYEQDIANLQSAVATSAPPQRD